MSGITYGYNGAEVQRVPVIETRQPDSNIGITHNDLSIEHVEHLVKNGVYFKVMAEWVCTDCGSTVPGPEGHERWECVEAARDANEERLADYRD